MHGRPLFGHGGHVPRRRVPLALEGGNLLSNGRGLCLYTSALLDVNRMSGRRYDLRLVGQWRLRQGPSLGIGVYDGEVVLSDVQLEKETGVKTLDERTEGWIAGLQLAALSMRGREDVSRFVRAFAGDNRYVVDYLVEEVLQRQPEPVRSFLLQTAILDRLSGPLCDAVTGQVEGKARLVALERGNFFVVPLDDKRHWYRYHHLFADVLRTYASDDEPRHLAARHRSASAWFQQHADIPAAIRHALAANDAERAAGLIEMARMDFHLRQILRESRRLELTVPITRSRSTRAGR